MSKYVIPMFESERGWGSKIDGYAGPFETYEEAMDFSDKFNEKNNPPGPAPDYYIMALEPKEYTNQKCNYRMTV